LGQHSKKGAQAPGKKGKDEGGEEGKSVRNTNVLKGEGVCKPRWGTGEEKCGC